VIGTLANDGWGVTVGWYSEEGPGRSAAPPSPLLAVPSTTATHQRPVYLLFDVAL